MDRWAGISLPDAFDDLAVGVTLHHPESGAILDVNERLEELYGYAADELREMDVGEYTAPSTKFSQEEAVRRIRRAAAGEPQEFEWRIERSDGERRWVRVHLEATAIDDAPCVLAEIRDVTAYKARERRSRLLNRVVRHNLRNEMNVLLGYATDLEGAVGDDALEAKVETILDIATNIGTLSDSISQIEEIAEPGSTRHCRTDVCAVVREVAEEFRDERPAVDLAVDVPDPVWVDADNGVRYAIHHAIRNAIEHNDADAPAVTVRVRDDSDRAIVRVVDNGPPIPDVETAVLDEEVETSSTYHGSGVGLWVMQWCVDSLGGELAFETNSPRGNTVRLSLPTVDPPDDGR